MESADVIVAGGGFVWRNKEDGTSEVVSKPQQASDPTP